ncbi:hypothetical protein DRQ36_06075 [bacterium]|nr:MAG: hypothetical protein DRQ36_06075 [bacterium]
MRRFVALLLVVLIAVFGIGCCGAVDEAKEVAKAAKEVADAATKFAEDMEKLKDEEGNFELTQKRIDRFIEHYPVLMRIIEEKQDKVERAESESSMVGITEFASLDKDLRNAGIDNAAEFYLTLIEVSAGIYYIIYEEQMESAKEEIAKGIEEMKKQLENPDVPEDQKEAIREAVKSMEESETFEAPEGLTGDELSLIRANFDKLVEVMDIEIEQEEETAEKTIE